MRTIHEGSAERRTNPVLHRLGRDDPDFLSDEFIAAARAPYAGNRRLSVAGLAAELRRSGWCNVEPRHVDGALRRSRPAMPTQRVETEVSGRDRHPDEMQRPARSGTRHPGNAGRLRSFGETRREGADGNYPNSAYVARGGSSSNVSPAAAWDNRLPDTPVFCPACDVRVSLLGRCRCS